MPRQMDCTASGKGNEKKDGMGSSKVVVTTTMKMEVRQEAQEA